MIGLVVLLVTSITRGAGFAPPSSASNSTDSSLKVSAPLGVQSSAQLTTVTASTDHATFRHTARERAAPETGIIPPKGKVRENIHRPPRSQSVGHCGRP